MGNNVTTDSKEEAANILLHRDHPRVVRFLREYGHGFNLGSYFVPPVFIGSNPEVLSVDKYIEKTKGKGKHQDGLRGQIAEEFMYNALQKHFQKTKDNVLVVQSHKFLNSAGCNEKDFIVLNLTRGYVMAVEVKANGSLYQKAKHQLFDAKERIQEVLRAIGLSTEWLFVGVFFAQAMPKLTDGKVFFDCDECSTFAIIGPENIEEKLIRIDEKVTNTHKNWVPSEHVIEFVELTKQILFITQGDPFAPVTESSFVNKISDNLKRASKVENILFWTMEQLSLVQAVQLAYVFLDAFYSTGKSEILKYIVKHWIKQKKVVHYFVHRPEPDSAEESLTKLPFTLMLEHEFKNINVQIKETTFKFGVDSLRKFLLENGIEQDHCICFDEVICSDYSNSFSIG